MSSDENQESAGETRWQPEAKDADRYDFRIFRSQHPTLAERHEEFLNDKVYGVADELLGLVLECLHLCETRPEEERRDNFVYAFILLGSKIISHVESIRVLINIARYGDAAAITRVLIGDITMLQYLSIYPDEASEWVELSQVRQPAPTRKGRYGELLKKFRESAMRRRIKAAGVRPVSAEGYGAYSEAAHPSLWGMQFYAPQEFYADGQFFVSYAPVYQIVKAWRRAMVMAALLLDATESFMAWCEQSKVEWHKELLHRWIPVQARTIDSLGRGMAIVTEGLERFYRSPRN